MVNKEKKLSEKWATIKIKDLMAKTRSINPIKSPDEKFELWSVPAFSTDSPEYVYGKDVGSNKQLVQEDDVLLCKINPRINRVWLVREKKDGIQIASTEWVVLRCRELFPKFIMYQLREEGFRNRLSQDLSGVGGSLTRARPKIVGELELKIAPIDEQKRIVNKIEELQTKSRNAHEALDTIPNLLGHLRESILAAAFRGDLTKKWRELNPEIESATDLLKRILIERHKRWEEAELEKLKIKGLSGEKLEAAFTKRCKHYKEPAPADTTDLPDLPEGWCWASLEQISEWITDGTHQPPPFTEKGIPFLVISNMVSGKIEWDTVKKWVSFETYEKYTGNYKPCRGDIIYSTVGTYGVAVQVETDKKFMFQRHIGHIRPLFGLYSLRYLTFSLNSPICKMQADKFARGVAQKTVNLSDLRRFAIPLAPLNEQSKLAELVSKILPSVDKQRTKMESLLDTLDSFDQSVLSKAFRGELTPQDHNDEPASVLLDRIRNSREAETKQSKVKRMPKSKSKATRRPLLEVLREYKKPMTPEQLFRDAGYKPAEVDLFYRELVSMRKIIIEKKPSSSKVKTWPYSAHVLLELKEG